MNDKINLACKCEVSSFPNHSAEVVAASAATDAAVPFLVNTENYRPDCQDGFDYASWKAIKDKEIEDAFKARRAESVLFRYQAQREIKSVLYPFLRDDNASILKCMTTQIKAVLELKRVLVKVGDIARPQASVPGLCHCHSYSSCPVDAPSIAVARRMQIRQLCYKAKKSDYELYFGTVTVRHSWDDSLLSLLSALRCAFQDFWADRAVKDAIKPFIGRVTTLEIMFGFSFGFHPHFHLLFIGQKGIDCEAVRKILVGRLLVYYKKHGLTANDDIAFDLKPCTDIEDYLTKIPCELSLGNVTKHGHGEHYTFFQLAYLSSITTDKKKRKQIRDRIAEYYYATKGRHFIQFSRGLLERFGMKDFKDDSPRIKVYGEFPIVEGGSWCRLSFSDKASIMIAIEQSRWKEVYKILDSKGVIYWHSWDEHDNDCGLMSEKDFESSQNTFCAIQNPISEDLQNQ